MNTPMQELIEQLKELKAYTAVTHGLERSLPYQTAIDYAETMLEQEKETIKDAYDAGLFDGSMEDVDNRLYKDYYNKTFNTSVEMNKQEILNQLHQHIKACSAASLSDAVMAFHEAIKLVEQLDEKQGPEVRWKPQPGEFILVRDHDSAEWKVLRFMLMARDGKGVVGQTLSGDKFTWLQYKRIDKAILDILYKTFNTKEK
jgi:hypothetical protein